MIVFSALRSAVATKGSVALREQSPDMDWFVAHASLEQFRAERDPHTLTHGVTHLASLLAAAPALPLALELVDAYREAAGGALLSILPPQGERPYYATEALRAYAFADEGRIADAVDLMLAVQRAKPDAAYLETWVPAWIEPVIGTLAPEQLLYVFGAALMAFPEAKAMTLAREQRLRRIVALAVEAAPRLSGPQWDMTLIGLHRKAGLFDEAIRRAKEASELRPGWATCTALGLALREAGSMNEAEAAFAQALAHEPDDLSALLETADGWFAQGAWSAARSCYERVLARAADHPWAEPSALFCAWREVSPHAEIPDEHYPTRLRELAAARNPRANGLAATFRPWEGRVPAPTDALVGSLREMERLASPRATITVTDVEAPSNEVAFALYARIMGAAPATVSYGNVATPDPRLPVEPIAFELFRLDGARLVPALDPPAGDVRAAVEALAAVPFNDATSWAKASRIGASLGPAGVRDVLACMVHPSPPPAGFAGGITFWIPRVQLAAAQVVAHLDDGWDDSTRRAALFSLLLGPRDWVTTAAIVALTQLANDHPAIACDVHAAFSRLDAARPDRGGMTYEVALLYQWQALPTLFPNEREDLVNRLSALRDG